MTLYKEEYVVIHRGFQPCDPNEITINCPDKVGLGFDLARIVFEFGLCVTKGDISTEGRWCFVVFWVIPFNGVCASTVQWLLLKQRLEDACPHHLAPCWLPLECSPLPESERILLLLVSSCDRMGLLHGVTQALWKMELAIHKMKVSTTPWPNRNAVHLFFVTDNRTKLPWSKKRAVELEIKLRNYFQSEDEDSFIQTNPASPQYGGLTCFPLSTSEATEIFCDDLATFEQDNIKAHKSDKTRIVKNPVANHVVVTVDNHSNPVHTLLNISCRNGLLYDCLRIVKDLNLKVAHARIPNVVQGLEKENSELCLFVVDLHGQKITNPQEQKVVVQCMEEAVGNPVRIKIGTQGVDTELIVATPIEKGGRGRPRALYTITQALKVLGINIFKAEFGRHEYNEKQWEIYRFLLEDKEYSFSSLTRSGVHNRIVCQVRQGLLG